MKLIRAIIFAFLMFRDIAFGQVSTRSYVRSETEDFLNQYPADVLEEATLDVDQLILRNGYPVERHFVQTQDGYVLTLFRIPRPNVQPFLLQHGLLDSAATYVMMGPNIGLGYILFDAGYDVWLGNTRGNYYSRNHTKLNPDIDMEFWNFSFHEMGIYDIPAMIDYILQKTKFQKILYAGHSQGCSGVVVLCSKKPEYNKKILMIHALAPATFMRNFPRGLILFLARNFRPIEIGLDALNMHEFSPRGFLLREICLVSALASRICLDLLSLLQGESMQLNKTKVPLLWNQFPAGSALKQLKHYAQLLQSGQFCEFDYGGIGNTMRYGNSEPPKYDFSKITTPIILYYGSNDRLVTPENVKRFYTHLPNVQGMFKAENFNHMDLVWGMDVKKMFYYRLLNVTRDFIAGNLSIRIEGL